MICSEDVGPAAPGVASDVRALYENARDKKSLAGGMFLAHAVILLATAEKSRVAC